MNYEITTSDLGIKVVHGTDITHSYIADTLAVTHSGNFLYFPVTGNAYYNPIDLTQPIIFNGEPVKSLTDLMTYLDRYLTGEVADVEYVDHIYEKTLNHGVDIDGVLLKDGKIQTMELSSTKFLVGGATNLAEETINMTWTKGTHPTRDTLRLGTITDNAKLIVSTDNLNAVAIAGKSEVTSASAGAEIQNFGWLTSNSGYNVTPAFGTKKNRFNIGANMDADLLLSSPHQIRICAYDSTTTDTNPDLTVEGGDGNIVMISKRAMKFAPWSGGEDIEHQYLKLTAETETVFDVNTHSFTGGNLKLSTLSGPLNINGSYLATTGLKTIAGTEKDPSISFIADPNTGFINSGADSIGVVVNGSEKWAWSSSGGFNPTTDNDANKTIGTLAVTPSKVYAGTKFALKGINATAGTYGLFEIKYKTAKQTPNIEPTELTIDIPAGVRLLAVQFSVDIEIIPAATATSWKVSFTGGSTAVINAGANAFAVGTKLNVMLSETTMAATAVTSGVTQISIISNDGTDFTSGLISAIVYYEELTSITT